MSSEAGPALAASDLSLLIDEVKDYQLTHGSLLKLVQLEEATTVLARPVGVSLLPTPFPRHLYQEAVELQPIFSELYLQAASDPEWLSSVLKPLIEHDDFVAALWYIHNEVEKVGSTQDVHCAMSRSDYMLHQDESEVCLKQIEMNTVSVAGVCHAEKVARMHLHLGRVRDSKSPKKKTTRQLPGNTNISGLLNTLKATHALYQPTTPGQTCVLMIVQPRNFNIADERPIEYGLWNEEVPCFRCEWQSVLEQTMCANDGTLLFCPSSSKEAFEVSVIYYRAGYEASEYDSYGVETRLRLETSRAIKCPDIITHLMTFKAVQQALTQPGVLERFLSSPTSQARIGKTFMTMHALNGPNARQIASDPEQAQDFVLKPNLEGGGHNVHRSAIPGYLSSIPEEHWRNHILMHLVRSPPNVHGTLMTPEGLYEGPVISELGVLGACIWRRKGSEVLSNEAIGWTFKSKPWDVEEMSVVKGFGCFDCPALSI